MLAKTELVLTSFGSTVRLRVHLAPYRVVSHCRVVNKVGSMESREGCSKRDGQRGSEAI